MFLLSTKENIVMKEDKGHNGYPTLTTRTTLRKCHHNPSVLVY